MTGITTGNARQYSTSEKLAARARLHQNYTVAEQGWFEWLVGQLPLKAGDRILDAGCGPGWFWRTVAATLPRDLDLTLLDLSAGMVTEAMDGCKDMALAAVHGQQADAAAMPFADNSFDVVIAMHMFYHLPDQARGMAEMFRVLKPGGFLAVTTNGIGNLRGLYQLTTVLGSPPEDPAGLAFGYDQAERLMQAQFGAVTFAEHPASLRVTDPDDVFAAFTSYPPGDGASEAQLAQFRAAIDVAFVAGHGALETPKQTGLFVSRKKA